LPPLHERHRQTHLLRLVIGLNVEDEAAVRTFEPAAMAALGRASTAGVRREAAALFAASQLARTVMPALTEKIAVDSAPIIEAVARLDEPWCRYYPAVVAAGLMSLTRGMGISGYTTAAAAP
jgi:hypothetical protein